ncbi:MAG: DUF364 domain-containing protein [Bacteroidales bacterium]
MNFKEFGNIVMVGYFESLYDKFKAAGIPVRVFDISKQSEVLSDMEGLYGSLAKADAVVLTGTTIFNETFMEVVGSSSQDSSLFLLGPSNT